MARRLNLQAPLVFEQIAPPSVRRLALLLVIVPAGFLVHWAISSFTGVLLIIVVSVIVLLSICILAFAFDGAETTIVVDADGIERRAPLTKKRLLWNDGLGFRIHTYRGKSGVVRTYYVTSPDSSISFGENLRNYPYLLSLVDAGINSIADKHSIVHAPLPTLDTTSTESVASYMVAGVLLLIGALVIGALGYDEAKALFLTPTVSIKDVAKYAGKDTEIRVNGKVHAEPPVVARDNEHTYAFQYVQLDGPSGTPLAIVTDPYIVDGSDKLQVTSAYTPPGYFGDPRKTTFQKDWQNSDVGKLVTWSSDNHFKDHEKVRATADHTLSVWNIEQDIPVTVMGRVKSEKGALSLVGSEGSLFWLTPNPNRQLEQALLIKAGLMGIALGLGFFFLVAAYKEAARASS